MGLTAVDVMQSEVVTVSPELSLLDAHQLFVSEEIHGAPVIDDGKTVCGVVSSADLLRVVAEEYGASGGIAVDYLRDLVEFSGPNWQAMPDDFQDRLRGLNVGDAMTYDVVHVAPEATLSEIARSLCDNRVHRVVVMDGDHLAGIVSTMDLVGVIRRDDAFAT